MSDGEDEEEEEGYEVRKERREVLSWVDRKGKGKAREVGDKRVVEKGKGMAGSLPEEVLMHVSSILRKLWAKADE